MPYCLKDPHLHVLFLEMSAGFTPAEEGEAAGASHGLELVEVVGVNNCVAAVLWEGSFWQVAESRRDAPEYLCSRQGCRGFASQLAHKPD